MTFLTKSHVCFERVLFHRIQNLRSTPPSCSRLNFNGVDLRNPPESQRTVQPHLLETLLSPYPSSFFHISSIRTISYGFRTWNMLVGVFKASVVPLSDLNLWYRFGPEFLWIILYPAVQRVGQIFRKVRGGRLRLDFGYNHFSPLLLPLLGPHIFSQIISMNDLVEITHKVIYPVDSHKIAPEASELKSSWPLFRDSSEQSERKVSRASSVRSFSSTWTRCSQMTSKEQSPKLRRTWWAAAVLNEVLGVLFSLETELFLSVRALSPQRRDWRTEVIAGVVRSWRMASWRIS